MDQPRPREISEPSLRRLPAYLFYLQRIMNQGRQYISCTHIANDLRLDPTQVRKDLEATGIIGKPKVGYFVPQLVEALEEFLGLRNIKDAFLVGVGHLGAALMGYRGFRDFGLNIVAAFDSDPEKTGATIHGIQVLPLDKLANLAQRMNVHIGIIAVPAASAQEVADRMVEGGIRAVWNFAPIHLQVPSTVIVENVHLSSSLAVMTQRLAKMLHVSKN